MCGAAVGNYGAAVGNQAQLVGKCGPLPPAGWTETERKRPTVRGLKGREFWRPHASQGREFKNPMANYECLNKLFITT